MASPLKVSYNNFRYRHNPDGTWDSICLHCFLTAVRSSKREELANLEALHHCLQTLDYNLFKLSETHATVCELLDSPFDFSPETRANLTEVRARLESEIDESD